MNPRVSTGLIVKLRPAGPWRSGPDSGARNRVDPIYHSDSLFAAVTAAMSTLGMRDAWLDATARHPEGPVVRFSSCFPFQGETAFIVPPRSIWPPIAQVSAARTRWKSARFIPLPLVASMLGGQPPHEGEWTVDGASECLLPAGQLGPFRANVRWSAAIDRLTGNAERHSAGCIEFRRDAGLWAIVSFSGEDAHASWSEPVRGALRLLADSGFGGERSRGWGRSAQPEFTEGSLPDLILPAAPAQEPTETVSGADSPALPYPEGTPPTNHPSRMPLPRNTGSCPCSRPARTTPSTGSAATIPCLRAGAASTARPDSASARNNCKW